MKAKADFTTFKELGELSSFANGFEPFTASSFLTSRRLNQLPTKDGACSQLTDNKNPPTIFTA